jgi:hypothetical protein
MLVGFFCRRTIGGCIYMVYNDLLCEFKVILPQVTLYLQKNSFFEPSASMDTAMLLRVEVKLWV